MLKIKVGPFCLLLESQQSKSSRLSITRNGIILSYEKSSPLSLNFGSERAGRGCSGTADRKRHRLCLSAWRSYLFSFLHQNPILRAPLCHGSSIPFFPFILRKNSIHVPSVQFFSTQTINKQSHNSMPFKEKDFAWFSKGFIFFLS